MLRTAALAVGATFLLVGVLGLIPGITSNYDEMGFAGHDSMAKLFGVFQVSVLAQHRAPAVRGRRDRVCPPERNGPQLSGRRGVIYLVLWLFGLVVDKGSGANFVSLNTADTGCTCASASG